ETGPKDSCAGKLRTRWRIGDKLAGEAGRVRFGHKLRKRHLWREACGEILPATSGNELSEDCMKVYVWGTSLRIAAILCSAIMLGGPGARAVKNMAVIVSAGSKLADLPLTDLTKLCKGTQKAWPDGKSFVLVIKDPESAEMRGVVQKILGGATPDIKAAI